MKKLFIILSFILQALLINSCNTSSEKLDKLKISIRSAIIKIEDNNCYPLTEFNSDGTEMMPMGAIGSASGIYDIKKIDGKNLSDAYGNNNYEMDFMAIAEIQPFRIESLNYFGKVLPQTEIKEVNANYKPKSKDLPVDPSSPNSYYFYKELPSYDKSKNKIKITGVAYYEKKESGWVLKNFTAMKVEYTDDTKINP